MAHPLFLVVLPEHVVAVAGPEEAVAVQELLEGTVLAHGAAHTEKGDCI